MKIHRFIGDFNLSKKELEITNPENIKQIKDVLRIRVSEKIILSDGKGTEAEVVINNISNKLISVSVFKSINQQQEPKRKVTLFLAILKKENFELAVQKATEVGVSKIVPIVTERTIKTGLNIERLEKIALEASEQSGRNIVPTLSPIFNFKDALAEENKSDLSAQAGEKIIFHITKEDNIYRPNKIAEDISIFIGPEGGFTEKEINLAKDYGYSVASLGAFTLRGETAAIIATYRAAEGI